MSPIDKVLYFCQDNFWGIAGSLVSLFLSQKTRAVTMFISFFVGLICSLLFPHLLAEHISTTNSPLPALGFMCGMIGYSFCTGIIRFTREFSRDPLETVQNLVAVLRGKYNPKSDTSESSEAD